MPGRALLAAVSLLALSGCAALGGGEVGREFPTLRELFAVPGSRVAAAEGEVTLALGGKRVSLPAAVLLRGPDAFRVDLLDPLDRPAAVVFSDGRRLLQYLPAAAAAAALNPFPGGCEGISPGSWVTYALGNGPAPPDRPAFTRLTWLGRLSFQRREMGELREEILCRLREGRWRVERVKWICDDEPVLLLVLDDDGATPAGASRFTVRFPAARLEMRFDLREEEREAGAAGDLLRPALPPGTRWTEFDLVQGR